MTTQAAQTRTVAGREIPPPGRWKIDPAHSEIQFVARHMMIARTRGRFREFSGTIVVAEVPEHSSVEATIAAVSIDTGDPQRDEHLRSPEFLDVQSLPGAAVPKHGSASCRRSLGGHRRPHHPGHHQAGDTGRGVLRACIRPLGEATSGLPGLDRAQP
jgi:hypothetical protein